MSEFCVGCRHSGAAKGQFELLYDYLLNTLDDDGQVKLARFASIKVPICLLLAKMRMLGVTDENKWPSSAELVVHYERDHHEPTGYSPIGNDVDSSCTGRNR